MFFVWTIDQQDLVKSFFQTIKWFLTFFFFRMQLAVDVQIPDEFGGLDGEAIYIGTIILLFMFQRHHFF